MWPCKWWFWKSLSIIWTGSVLWRPLTYTVSIIFLKPSNEGGCIPEFLSQLRTHTNSSHCAGCIISQNDRGLFVCFLTFQASITIFHLRSKELLLLISNLNPTLASMSMPQQGTGFEELLMFQREIFWTDSFRTCDFYFKLFSPASLLNYLHWFTPFLQETCLH